MIMMFIMRIIKRMRILILVQMLVILNFDKRLEIMNICMKIINDDYHNDNEFPYYR